jgi:hypothetical protein
VEWSTGCSRRQWNRGEELIESRTEGIEKKGDGGKEGKQSLGCLVMQAQEQKVSLHCVSAM